MLLVTLPEPELRLNSDVPLIQKLCEAPDHLGRYQIETHHLADLNLPRVALIGLWFLPGKTSRQRLGLRSPLGLWFEQLLCIAAILRQPPVLAICPRGHADTALVGLPTLPVGTPVGFWSYQYPPTGWPQSWLLARQHLGGPLDRTLGPNR